MSTFRIKRFSIDSDIVQSITLPPDWRNIESAAKNSRLCHSANVVTDSMTKESVSSKKGFRAKRALKAIKSVAKSRAGKVGLGVAAGGALGLLGHKLINND